MNGRWALGPEVKRSALAGGAMLYDTSRAGNLSADWFEPRYWESLGALDGSARGRAAARFVNSADGRRYVLRHYARGGLMARVSADRFLWHGEESTRPFAEWQLTWIVGRGEARLMRLLEGVEFITVDKRASLAGLAALRRELAARRFEVLLHMQLALRASLVASCVPARVKLGFDFARAREAQWLFTNARIAPRTREHVLDSFFGFPAALGIAERLLRWDLGLPAEAQSYAARLVPDSQPTLVISPC